MGHGTGGHDETRRAPPPRGINSPPPGSACRVRSSTDYRFEGPTGPDRCDCATDAARSSYRFLSRMASTAGPTPSAPVLVLAEGSPTRLLHASRHHLRHGVAGAAGKLRSYASDGGTNPWYRSAPRDSRRTSVGVVRTQRVLRDGLTSTAVLSPRTGRWFQVTAGLEPVRTDADGAHRRRDETEGWPKAKGSLVPHHEISRTPPFGSSGDDLARTRGGHARTGDDGVIAAGPLSGLRDFFDSSFRTLAETLSPSVTPPVPPSASIRPAAETADLRLVLLEARSIRRGCPSPAAYRRRVARLIHVGRSMTGSVGGRLRPGSGPGLPPGRDREYYVTDPRPTWTERSSTESTDVPPG